MTDLERHADALRRAHARDRGVQERMLLSWAMLQPSEQRRWLDAARDIRDAA